MGEWTVDPVTRASHNHPGFLVCLQVLCLEGIPSSVSRALPVADLDVLVLASQCSLGVHALLDIMWCLWLSCNPDLRTPASIKDV